MFSNMSSTAPCFILIEDASESAPQESNPSSDFATFQKNSLQKEPEIIIVDSTEDESEKSLVKSLEVVKRIKKNKNKVKQIKLCGHKKLFKLEEMQKSEQKLQMERLSLKCEITAEMLANENAFKSTESREKETSLEIQRILPLVQKNDIRMGLKYQCSLPKFQIINKENSRLNDILKNKEWDPSRIKEREFDDCKTLMQTILDLNYFTDDVVCKFLVMHQYNVEDTINYCFSNKDKLQKEIIDNYIPNDPLFRKTRNSLYNKFLMKKL